MCVVSGDGTTVATGTEQGQLMLHDMRYFGPSLQVISFPSVLPFLSPVSNTQNSTTTYTTQSQSKQQVHAIQSLASGRSTNGMNHLMAFQLRGGCRVGLYNILTHKIHMVEPDDTPLSIAFSPSIPQHGLTRSRIAFTKIDSTLFYGSNKHELHGVDCGPCVVPESPLHGTKYHHHKVDVGSMVTCVDTSPSGMVVAGLGSNDVILCNNSLSN